MTNRDYGIRKTLDIGFDEAVVRTRELLQTEGFGVLTEIDMKAKLKEKIGVDVRRYLILGACNPPLAYKALQAEPEIGLLLPCNVIVYEGTDGKIVVSAMDPGVISRVVEENPVVEEVARDARARLQRFIEKM